jgi:hypothetical protein
MAIWADKFSFLTGVVATRGLGFFALSDDSIDLKEIPHSQIVFWQAEKWGNSGPVKFVVVSASLCRYPIKQMIVIGPFGEVLLTGTGDLHEERVQAGNDNPNERGILRSVRGIGGKAYAVGMQRQVYRRDNRDLWVCIDRDMRPEPGQIVGFESIDGFAENDLYVVGWEGEIWHFDGRLWRRCGSPTNFILTDVCCAGDGNVYACGRVGMLLTGRDNVWRTIEHESMTEDIWSLAWFKDSLYVATYRGLFRLDADRLVPVDMGEDVPSTYFRLSAMEDVMWSIGAKDVMAFDGSLWTRIE